MLPLNLIRSTLYRSKVLNQLNFCKYSISSFIDRNRKGLMEQFDETNAQVFAQLKEMCSKSPTLDWSVIRQDIIKEHPRVYNQYNFEVQFMQHLIKLGVKDDCIISSFIDHVKKLLINQNNKVIMCHLIRFLLLMDKHPDVNYIRNGLEMVSQDASFIKYPVVGKAWAEFAMLSPETCKQSLDFAMKHFVFQNDALVNLVLNTLKFGMFEETEKLLLIYKEKKIADVVVGQWMDSLGKCKNKERLALIDRFIKILQDKRYLFQKSMLKKLESFLHSSGLYFKPGIIDKENCSCKVCGSPLETINENELTELRTAVESCLIKRQGEVYLVSTPNEVKNFNDFMNNHSLKPFDLVIDGLNVSYYNTTRAVTENEKTHSLSIKNLGLDESLYETMEINKIFSKYSKILVIGRKHMAGWQSIKKLRANHAGQVWIYLLDNKTEDDVFTIAASVRSLKTYLWTADFLRQYKELLGNDHMDLFEKWKYCRQIRFAAGSKRVLEFPNNIDYICQSTSSGQYHLPINMNVRVDSQERIIANWMCVGLSAR